MVIPRDPLKKGIVIEFKKVDQYDDEDLERAVQTALAQIAEKNYRQQLIEYGIENIIERGIAFEGKKVLVVKSIRKK